MTTAIKNALSNLDAQNDNHWTDEGLPRLDTVQMLAGDPSITREAVTAAVPGFTRSAVLHGAPADEAGAAGATEPEEQKVAPAEAGAPAAIQNPTPDEQVLQQPSPVPQAPKATEEQILAARELVEAENKKLVELYSVRDQAIRAARIQETVVNEAQHQLDKIDPPETTIGTLQKYLDRQKKNLLERAARKRKLQELQLNPEDLKVKGAPLDEAMRRHTGRGRPDPVPVNPSLGK